MKDVWPSMLFAFPLALYVGIKVAAAVPGPLGAFPAMFGLMFVLAVISAVPNERLSLWSSVIEVAATLSILVALYFDVGYGVQLLAGTLLAAPVLLLSYAVRPGPLGGRLFAFALALTVGLGLLATLEALTTASVVVAGGEFVREFVYLNVTQAQGLYGLLSATPGALPLRDLFDPDYVVLAAIAIIGFLFATLRPQTAWGDDLPAAGASIPDAGEEGAPADLPPDLVSALVARSIPEPAVGVPPGMPALLGACVAAVLVVAAAFASPTTTLMLVSAGIVLSLGVTFAVMRRTLAPSR